MARRREHQRAGIEHVRQRAGIILRIGRNLGERLVAGGFDEFLELPVGHRRTVDPEAVDGDAMRRRLFRIMLIRSHAERAAGNEDHIRMGRLLRPLRRCNVVHAPPASNKFRRHDCRAKALSENEAKPTAERSNFRCSASIDHRLIPARRASRPTLELALAATHGGPAETIDTDNG
jgi:hypothetical protein